VEVGDDGVEVEGGEFFCVVEVGVERVDEGVVLREDGEVEMVGPPVLVARDSCAS
jgi:hypothetical protein